MVMRFEMPTAPAAGSACPNRDFVAVMRTEADPPAQTYPSKRHPHAGCRMEMEAACSAERQSKWK